MLLSELDKLSKEYQVVMFENCLADDAMHIMNSFNFLYGPCKKDCETSYAES